VKSGVVRVDRVFLMGQHLAAARFTARSCADDVPAAAAWGIYAAFARHPDGRARPFVGHHDNMAWVLRGRFDWFKKTPLRRSALATTPARVAARDRWLGPPGPRRPLRSLLTRTRSVGRLRRRPASLRAVANVRGSLRMIRTSPAERRLPSMSPLAWRVRYAAAAPCRSRIGDHTPRTAFREKPPETGEHTSEILRRKVVLGEALPRRRSCADGARRHAEPGVRTRPGSPATGDCGVQYDLFSSARCGISPARPRTPESSPRPRPVGVQGAEQRCRAGQQIKRQEKSVPHGLITLPSGVL